LEWLDIQQHRGNLPLSPTLIQKNFAEKQQKLMTKCHKCVILDSGLKGVGKVTTTLMMLHDGALGWNKR
jgi:hypothetical protein